MKRFFTALGRALKNNWPTKLAALLFAFIIWSYVMASQNPIRDITVRGVRIDYIGIEELTAKNLTADLADMPETIDVTLEARQTLLSSINQSTVTAVVDLQSVNSTGKTVLDIDVQSNVSNATVVNMSQRSVALDIDRLSSRSVPIECEVAGAVKEGYYMSAPELSSATVKIVGPMTEVKKVKSAVCKVPVNGLAESVKATYELTLLDENGKEIVLNTSESSVPSVVVTINVYHKKTVPIEADAETLITNVKDGYEVTGIEIDPLEVDIAGSAEALAAISKVTLSPINMDGADSSVIMTAEVAPLKDAEVVSAGSISVYVKIAEKQSEKTFNNVPITVKNLGEGLKAKIIQDSTSVTVKGGLSALDGLKARDVDLYADLTGKGAGTYTVDVKANPIVGIEDGGITIENTKVTVIIS